MSAKAFPNKFPGNCTRCGARVAAGSGLTTKVQGKWAVSHNGTCPTTDPATEAQPQATQAAFTPTPEQARCVELFATGKDLVIQAGAGAGKTATLLLLAAQAGAQGRKGWYGAYNKKIVLDTTAKAPGNLACSTMHSLAYRSYGYAFAHRLPRTGNNTKGMARQMPSEVARILGLGEVEVGGKTLAAGAVASIVLGAVDAFTHSADAEVTVRHFAPVAGLDEEDSYTNNDALARKLLPFARKAWADMTTPDGKLRITHDAYLKAWQLSGPRINADFIMLDEAQDADPVQVAIIEHQRSFGTQVVVVGDSQQVLYEWRGAVNALADFEAMGAQVAYLTQSFRFGHAVAEVANGLLGRLGAELRIQGFGQVASTVGPVAEPRAILTRTNAGAITALLGALDAGQRPHLVGGGADVMAFCEAAQDLQAGRKANHGDLACFSTWAEVEYYVENEPQGADLKLMVKLVNEFGAEVIIDALRHQPKEEDADLVISTAHKSKGCQWASVQIAGDFLPPKEEGAELSAAELRLAYVAATRAQTELDLDNVPHFLGEAV
jgi:AAA domain/UvrD-like helicase C-terminal domain